MLPSFHLRSNIVTFTVLGAVALFILVISPQLFMLLLLMIMTVLCTLLIREIFHGTESYPSNTPNTVTINADAPCVATLNNSVPFHVYNEYGELENIVEYPQGTTVYNKGNSYLSDTDVIEVHLLIGKHTYDNIRAFVNVRDLNVA